MKVLPIYLTPLRERKEDIIPLAMHHIMMFNKEFKKNITGISDEAQKLLLNYPWHGNARELRNIIERIFILEDTEIIHPDHIPSEILNYYEAPVSDSMPIDMPNEGISLKDVEKDLITQALYKVNRNQTKAAKLLGISRDALRYKMQKIGLLS